MKEWRAQFLHISVRQYRMESFRSFGYKKSGDIWDLDWLTDWDFEREEPFVLHGMEPVQRAFAQLVFDGKQPLGVRMAEELAEHLVTVPFMELVAAAHKSAKRQNRDLKGLAVLATVHDWDTVHMTQ